MPEFYTDLPDGTEIYVVFTCEGEDDEREITEITTYLLDENGIPFDEPRPTSLEELGYLSDSILEADWDLRHLFKAEQPESD